MDRYIHALISELKSKLNENSALLLSDLLYGPSSKGPVAYLGGGALCEAPPPLAGPP